MILTLGPRACSKRGPELFDLKTKFLPKRSRFRKGPEKSAKSRNVHTKIRPITPRVCVTFATILEAETVWQLNVSTKIKIVMQRECAKAAISEYIIKLKE